MDMQDKDLDKLFQSALDDYEIAPSAGAWMGITEKLDAGKNKRKWMPFLSIAAGLVLLITIGVLFMPKPVKVDPAKKDDNALVKNTPVIKPVQAPVAPVVAKVDPLKNKNQQRAVIAPVNNLAVIKKHKRSEIITPAKPATIIEQQTNPANADDQPVLAATQRNHDIANPVLPDTGTPIMVKQTIDNAPVFASITPVATPAATLPAVDKQAPPVKKHRIRSFGDVLNVVIAAVDKRDKKIIQFSNTDGEDATITGVNLGIIKINKDK